MDRLWVNSVEVWLKSTAEETDTGSQDANRRHHGRAQIATTKGAPTWASADWTGTTPTWSSPR
jgi:hypothetical protein